MGAFTNSAITEAGRVLLAEVQAGAVFTPTRLVIGSGSIPNGKTAQTMTDVVAAVKSLPINKKQRTPDGKAIFGAVYSNEDITTAFYFRELALFAKPVHLNADGTVASEGAEVLYTYGNAGDKADYMPAYSTSTVVEKQIDIVTYVGNNTQVDLTVESGVYASKEELAAVVATANGAVKKTGDRMTGNLEISHDTDPSVFASNTITGRLARVVSYNNNAVRIENHKDGFNYAGIDVGTEADALDGIARLVVLKDGAWGAYNLLHSGNKHLIKPDDIGARKNTSVLTTTPPETWGDVESLGGGEHEWVQTGPLEWEPNDTPTGMVRVVLSIFPGVGNTYFLRYIDGSANKTMYFGEMNRWTRVATTEDAVSKAGDTMHGTLNVALDGGNAVLVSDAACAYLQTFQDGDWENRRTMLLRNEQSATVDNMLTVAAKTGDGWKEFPVLHMGNRSLVSTTYTATISTTWTKTSDGDFYYQGFTVPGLLATDNPIVDILTGSDNAANALYIEEFCKVVRIVTYDNSIQVFATEKTNAAFTIQLKVVR